MYCFVSIVLFMYCLCVKVPPSVKPIAVKYIISYHMIEWSVGKTTNTRYYRHVLAALGNTDFPAMEEDRVLRA